MGNTRTVQHTTDTRGRTRANPSPPHAPEDEVTEMDIRSNVGRFFQPHRRAALLALAAVLLVPAMAWAIPGAGDFTSLDSPTGREMAGLYNLLAKICFVIFTIVAAVMIGAIVRFRRRSEDERPAQTHGNFQVEMGILVAATILQIFIGWRTIEVMWYVEKMPETEITIEAIGYQWDWQFRYPDQGGFISEDLVIPAHTNVRLNITSKDVIHSLFIPELGVKMDAVPGRFNYWWVNADGPINQTVLENDYRISPKNDTYNTTRPSGAVGILNALNFFPESEDTSSISGLERRVDYLAASRTVEEVSPYAKYDAVEYRGMCTELCGKGHYDMYFRTVAMTPASFKKWVEFQQNGGDGEVNAEGIYTKNCSTCHGAAGEGVAGQFPPLAGADYIAPDTEENKRRHIGVVLNGLNGEIVVNGVKYNGVMQPWFNVLNDEEVAAVVNHERTSWGNNYGVVDAKMVAEEREAAGHPPYPAGGVKPLPEADLMNQGAKIYASCASCHGATGVSKVRGVPNLKKNPTVLSSPEDVVSYLVNGKGKKGAQGASMTNEEIASIVTYIRKSFGNQASVVQPGEIGRIRKEVTKAR